MDGTQILLLLWIPAKHLHKQMQCSVPFNYYVETWKPRLEFLRNSWISFFLIWYPVTFSIRVPPIKSITYVSTYLSTYVCDKIRQKLDDRKIVKFIPRVHYDTSKKSMKIRRDYVDELFLWFKSLSHTVFTSFYDKHYYKKMFNWTLRYDWLIKQLGFINWENESAENLFIIDHGE
jgi:hypothetical protein